MRNLNKKDSPFTASDLPKPEVQLHSLCELLNDSHNPERREAFRALVKPWLKAGSLKEMLKNDPSTWVDLWTELEMAWKPYFTPEGSGVVWAANPIPRSPELPQTAREWAIRNFALLVLNPLRDRLHGPCDRCGRYFLKRRATKVFCSQSCRNAASATRSTAELARADKKARVKCAARFWLRWTERIHPNRSLWIAERVNGSQVRIRTKKGWKPVRHTTPKWVSRNKVAIQKIAS